MLRRDGEITASSIIDDPWGDRYQIICDDDDTIILSAGPDGKIDTADDLKTR